jgi:hypothetical protein
MINKMKSLFSTKKPLEDVSGVYLGDNRYLRIVQQPRGRPEFVSGMSGVATSFQLASQYGTIGLIAHNFLGGRFFLESKVGDEIHVLDGFGRSRCYRVINIRQFQALEPRSPRSRFIDLDTHQTCTASEVFKEIYTGEHHLVLQTCIEKGQIKEWGRQFVIAELVNDKP